MEALKKSFTEHVQCLQAEIIEQMKKIDPSLKVNKDPNRKDKRGDDGGGGITCALTEIYLKTQELIQVSFMDL